MTFGRSATVMILVLGLGACTTTKSARDQIVRSGSNCVDQQGAVYFEADSAEIGKEGLAVIKAAAKAAKSCKVTQVEVRGLADATGAPDANLDLSKRRARSVAAALSAAGFPAAEFRMTAVGDAGATTAGGQAAPLRRRADVIVHLAPL